ncbi:NAD-dependent epimerase/dehydratase family protein [Nitrospina gracilis]|uniref:NAD-dependent epimerase/dehydratase family protein n=1 Tax=Nitrospina gracilis TaxID=35801 RepID=UPI001EFFEDE8|nr:NAD-dependent epimerase/dehydratase family protein [Nitrospina gracilis]MCF8720689.1 nucleoside-diphosphate-sugar epimerase [Nitrospina gracilis Nb-211]
MNILVTGGSGFLGGHIARRLHALGHSVTALGRRGNPDLPGGIDFLRADLTDHKAIIDACRDRDAVFHAGALTGIWGNRDAFYRTNVEGTQNVIAACLQHGVTKLIHTSSPSVVYDGADIENGNESLPYARRYLCDYPKTKALAEQRVLEANGQNGLSTLILRPHLIWGPGDPHLVPRIIERARKGRLVRVGDGTNRVDIIYIDNAVEGHVKALEALLAGKPVAGGVYFLSDGAPVRLWDWINDLLNAVGVRPVTRSISYRNGKRLGALLESVHRLFGLEAEPRMTRFLASQLATSHYFDITRARQDLNYEPVVSPEEGMERLVTWWKARPSR